MNFVATLLPVSKLNNALKQSSVSLMKSHIHRNSNSLLFISKGHRHIFTPIKVAHETAFSSIQALISYPASIYSCSPSKLYLCIFILSLICTCLPISAHRIFFKDTLLLSSFKVSCKEIYNHWNDFVHEQVNKSI